MPNLHSTKILGDLRVTGLTNISDQLTSTVATGTAPFIIASTTRVSNLNVATAGVADTVTLTADNSTNATNYPLFTNAATGNLSPRTDTGFTYNPSTGVLTSTTFTGALSGNASSASLIATTQKSDSVAYNIPFVTNFSAGNQSLYTDSEASITYNPSTNLLTLAGNLTLTGASTITTSTGNLTLSTSGGNGDVLLEPNGTGRILHTKSLASKGANYTSTWMQFDENVNGNALYLGSGALTVIGGGESIEQIKGNIGATSEALIFGSDEATTSTAFRFIASLQNNWANRTEVLTMTGAGNATLLGSLTLTGANSVSTSTGNLTLSSGGGNGSIYLSPNGSGKVRLTTLASAGFVKTDASGDLSIDSNTYLTAHPVISAASSSDNSGRTYIQDITLDENGHVIGIATATETVTNTNTATAADNILDGSNSGTEITYAPYGTAAAGKLSSVVPTTGTTILGYSGNFYANVLYAPSIYGGTASGGNLTIGSTSHGTKGTVTLEGNLSVSGNLTINGTTSTINATTITVDDKNIELGSVASPTDTTADGGGITLKGTTDKTFNWVDSTDAWTSSEHIEVADGKTYRYGSAAWTEYDSETESIKFKFS